MGKEYFYRCKSNPTGPILKLQAWEAKDMQNHPDYERIDEFGELVVEEDLSAGTIPFQGSTGRR